MRVNWALLAYSSWCYIWHRRYWWLAVCVLSYGSRLVCWWLWMYMCAYLHDRDLVQPNACAALFTNPGFVAVGTFSRPLRTVDLNAFATCANKGIKSSVCSVCVCCMWVVIFVVWAAQPPPHHHHHPRALRSLSACAFWMHRTYVWPPPPPFTLSSRGVTSSAVVVNWSEAIS